jgi:hypothetical protein
MQRVSSLVLSGRRYPENPIVVTGLWSMQASTSKEEVQKVWDRLYVAENISGQSWLPGIRVG